MSMGNDHDQTGGAVLVAAMAGTFPIRASVNPKRASASNAPTVGGGMPQES